MGIGVKILDIACDITRNNRKDFESIYKHVPTGELNRFLQVFLDNFQDQIGKDAYFYESVKRLFKGENDQEKAAAAYLAFYNANNLSDKQGDIASASFFAGSAYAFNLLGLPTKPYSAEDVMIAVMLERECCAAIADSVNNHDNPMTARDVADAIRNRK